MIDRNNGHSSGLSHPKNDNCKIWGCKKEIRDLCHDLVDGIDEHGLEEIYQSLIGKRTISPDFKIKSED